jgi:hypothetical protein
VSAVCYLAVVALSLPAIPNHRVVLAGVAIALLGVAGGRLSIDTFAATGRWLTLILYTFAVAAKLNTAYLDPTVSCATVFFKQTLAGHGLAPLGRYPVWLEIAPIVWSIGSEVALLVLLIVPRTRLLGVAFGLLFHLTLAADYVKFFGNFSAAMSILLFAWLDEEHAQELRGRWPRLWKVVVPGASGVIALAYLASHAAWLNPIEFVVVRQIAFLLVFVGLISGVVSLVGRWWNAPPPASLGRPWVGLVVLAVLNGLSPYLGLKTRSGFTMYSNLRIEAAYSNHLFAPPSSDPLGLLSDVVLVRSTGDPALQRRIEDGGTTMTYAELCTYLEWRGDVAPGRRESASPVQYERGGAEFVSVRGAPLPSDCPTLLVRRLTFFGPIGPGSERACVW